VVLEGRGREMLPSKATRYPLTENRGREKITCESHGREPCDVSFGSTGHVGRYEAHKTVSNNYNESVGGYLTLTYETVAEEQSRRRRQQVKPSLAR
jgi:hypothetical protein